MKCPSSPSSAGVQPEPPRSPHRGGWGCEVGWRWHPVTHSSASSLFSVSFQNVQPLSLAAWRPCLRCFIKVSTLPEQSSRSIHMGLFNDWKKASFYLTSGRFSFVPFLHDAFERWSDRDQFWYCGGHLLFWSDHRPFPCPTPLRGKGRDLRPKLCQSDSSGNFNHEWNNIRSEK